MLGLLKVVLAFIVCCSLSGWDVEAQLPVVGALKNFLITEGTVNGKYLVLSWRTDEKDVAFQFVSVEWSQALPDHSLRHHFVPSSDQSLTVENGTHYSYRLDGSLLVPDFMGPLLFTVTATIGSTSIYQSDEVLYTPREQDQTRSEFSLNLVWPEGVNCEIFMSTVASRPIATELEYRMRQQSPEFKLAGKIENFSCHCLAHSTLCSGTVLSTGSSNNATLYTAQLSQWLQQDGSRLVIEGRSFSVAPAPCERYNDDRHCLEFSSVAGESSAGAGLTTSDVALVISLVSMGTVLAIILGLVVYLTISKCLAVNRIGKPTPTFNNDVEMEARNRTLNGCRTNAEAKDY